MKKIIAFLSELRENNDREWFARNKTRYEEIRQEFDAFVEQLIVAIARFDPSVAGLSVKDCTYRIYRDTRFSKNKEPYKTHIGAYVCSGGKKSGRAGYYFHIEPKGDGLIGGNLMSSGLYMPEPNVLRSIRDEFYDNGKQMLAAIAKAKGFRLNGENKLKRVPAGYAADSPYAEYLKLKDIYLERFFDDDFLLQDRLAEAAAAEFRKTAGFTALLNRAVDFAREEM